MSGLGCPFEPSVSAVDSLDLPQIPDLNPEPNQALLPHQIRLLGQTKPEQSQETKTENTGSVTIIVTAGKASYFSQHVRLYCH